MAAKQIGMLVGLLFAIEARAQDALFLAPAKFAAAVGERIVLTLREGAADRVWSGPSTEWFLVRVAGMQENLDRPPRTDGVEGAVKVDAAGAAVIGVDFAARDEEERPLPGHGKGMGNAPEGRPEGRIVVIRSAKAIVRVGEAERGQSGNVTAKTGQRVEIRPTFDPTAVGIGSDVPLVVYAGDGKAPGAVMTAVHVASGERQEFVANESGVGSFRLSQKGEWRIEARRVVEKEGKRVLHVATLTFEAGGAARGGGGM